MVTRQTLDLLIQVRILVSQPISFNLAQRTDLARSTVPGSEARTTFRRKRDMVGLSVNKEAVRKYAVVIEKGQNNLSAYVPDLPGCITTGRSLQEIERNIREAIELHLKGLRADGEPIPEPSTDVQYVELQTA